MKKILYLILITASHSAICGEFGIVFHGYSFHTDNRLNSNNPGIGIRYQINDYFSIQSGRYKNTAYKHSNYAIVDFMPIKYGIIKAGLFSGVVNGHPTLNHGDYIVTGGVAGKIKPEGPFDIGFRYIPQHGNIKQTLFVELGISF